MQGEVEEGNRSRLCAPIRHDAYRMLSRFAPSHLETSLVCLKVVKIDVDDGKNHHATLRRIIDLNGLYCGV